MSPFRNGLNQGFFTPQSFMRDIRQTVCRPGTCSSVFADGSTIAGFLWQAVSLSSVITTARLHLNICVLFFFHVLDIFHPPVLHGIEHRSEFLTISVREYSTCGGISSYCVRSTSPFSTRDLSCTDKVA